MRLRNGRRRGRRGVRREREGHPGLGWRRRRRFRCRARRLGGSRSAGSTWGGRGARSAGTRSSRACSITSRIELAADTLASGGLGVDGDRAERECGAALDAAAAEHHVAAIVYRRARRGTAPARGRRRRAGRRRSRPRACSARTPPMWSARIAVVVGRRSPGGSQLVLGVPGAEHDRLALAGGERDRRLGIVGGELGGRDRAGRRTAFASARTTSAR